MKNNSFRATTHYILSKPGVKIMGGNMVRDTVAGLTAEFAMSRNLRLDIQRPVYHFALSVPRHENLSDRQFAQIANDYVSMSGLDRARNQYFVARHHDQEHHHIHIVASRIDLAEGKVAPIVNDYFRNQVICRRLERAYGLEEVPIAPIPPRVLKQLAQDYGLEIPLGVQVQTRKAITKSQSEKLEATGKLPVKRRLQNAIDRAAADQPSMPELLTRLQSSGIEVRVKWAAHRIQGLSYQMEGVAMTGTGLGARYTFPGLQKYSGVSYEPDRDDEGVRSIVDRANPVEELFTPTSEIAPPDSPLEESSEASPSVMTAEEPVPEVLAEDLEWTQQIRENLEELLFCDLASIEPGGDRRVRMSAINLELSGHAASWRATRIQSQEVVFEVESGEVVKNEMSEFEQEMIQLVLQELEKRQQLEQEQQQSKKREDWER